MTPEFWAEAYRIFSEALDLSPGARGTFAAARTEAHPDLRREVMALLDAHEASGRFLEIPTEREAPPRNLGAAGPGPGAAIGPWRLVEVIGQGGMGVVYRAERADGGFAQQAAIKLTRISLLDRDAARRFRAERSILAGLQHPHIVSLLDGGTLPTGEAWLAMEFVDGEPVTRYVAGRQLGLAARLRLFRDICAAVHHAHQHGVVHRDLKPQNVLVTADGVAKVVDFGLAKLLDTPHDGDTTKTGAGPAPLTPNTASPEQWRGLAVTTAADIYALGILLYELLTGVKPYDTTGKPLDEALALVIERVPGRPGTAAAPDGSVAGRAWPRRTDLDAIVLKALAKEPARRYDSAAALAADVGRYLDGRPVVAREPSFWYVASRVVRRHALASGAAVIALVAIVAGLGVAIWQAQVADRERQRAEARFAEVRQLANTLVFKVHDAVAPLNGSTPVRQTIVQEALGYLERLSREPGDDPTLRLELAAAYTRIGRVQGDPQQPNLGDRDGAIASIRRAAELVHPLITHPDTRIRGSALASTAAADTALQSIYSFLGRTDEAVEAARRSVASVERLDRDMPGNDEVRRRLGSAYFSLALALQGTPPAIDQWQKAGQVFEAMLAAQPDDPDRLRNVALVAKYLAGELEVQEHWAEAQAQAERALTLDERRLAVAPHNSAAQLDVSIDLVSVASGLTRAARFDDARAQLTRALDLRRRMADADPKDVLSAGKVGSVEWRLAENALKAGELAEAATWADRAVATMTRIVRRDRDIASLRDLAAAHTLRAQVLDRQGHRAAQCDAARRADEVVHEIRERKAAPIWTVLTTDLPPLVEACAGR